MYIIIIRRTLTGVDYSKTPTKRLFDSLMAAEEVRNSTSVNDLSRHYYKKNDFLHNFLDLQFLVNLLLELKGLFP